MALLLAGCTLIDQRTFNPHAEEKPVVAAAPSAAVVPEAPEIGSQALLRIPLPVPTETRAAVASAVAAARARKADVVFEVVGIAPEPSGGIAAAQVAQFILSEGVPAPRVRLAVRTDAGVRQEVRVYVR